MAILAKPIAKQIFTSIPKQTKERNQLANKERL
jgi:hypothetical protein